MCICDLKAVRLLASLSLLERLLHSLSNFRKHELTNFRKQMSERND